MLFDLNVIMEFGINVLQQTKWTQRQTDHFYATAEEMRGLGCGASGCPYNKTRAELMANLFNQFYSSSCSGFTDLLEVSKVPYTLFLLNFLFIVKRQLILNIC